MKAKRVVLCGVALVFTVCFCAGCRPGEPLAAFEADVTTGPAPLRVVFTDLSVIQKAHSINGWEWNFGDGAVSTEQNPEHTYTAAGNYTVSLAVMTSKGKSNTAVLQNYITVSSASPDEGEGETEGEGEGEGEIEGAGVYVWGTGDDWREQALDEQNTPVDTTPLTAELKLHRMPDYDVPPVYEEHEAVLHFNGFLANAPGTLHFLEYPKAAGDDGPKTWHMVSHQYQVRLVPSKANYVEKNIDPSTAMLTMVVGAQSEIPAGFSPVADLHVWRMLPGQAVDEAGEQIPNEACWFNLTNGHESFVWTNTGKSPGVYQSVSFPVGNQVDCPGESPVNYALIAPAAPTPPRWQQDLNNDPRTAGWLTPPPQCPAPPPAGYRYAYQGHTVVVNKVTQSCTLPGISDPVNPREYPDSPTDVTLIHSTTTVNNFVCERDVIVGHTWKLVPDS